MNSSLPLPSSLASALSHHGAHNINAFSSTSSPAQAAPPPSSSTRTTIRALTIHPSLPRTAYLSEETISLSSTPPITHVPSKKKPFQSTYSSAVIQSQCIVIQKYNNNKKTHGLLNEQDVVTRLPLEQLVVQLNRFRTGKLVKNPPVGNEVLTLASMGPLQCMEFVDSRALSWKIRSCCNDAIVGTGCDKNNTIRNPDTYFDGLDGGLGGDDLCLSLQFTRVLTVVRLSDSSRSVANHTPFKVLCCLEGQRGHSQYTPTSGLLPLTDSIVVYGCSDGAMRFHNLVPSLLYSSRMENDGLFLGLSTSLFSSGATRLAKQSRQSTVKSVRGPNGRNDPIVKIVNVDPACNSGGGGSSDSKSAMLHSRLLTACASGVAYLWDVHICIDCASGSVRDLIVDPPLVRIDGLGKLTVSPRKEPATSVNIGGFWHATTARSQKGDAPPPYSTRVPAINYDYNRDLLIWALPSEAPAASIDHRGDFKLELADPNSAEAKKEDEDKAYMAKWSGNGDNGGFVKVWNMSTVDAIISKSNKKNSSAGPQPPPKFAPAAVYKLHPFSASATTSCAFGGLMVGPLNPNSLAYTCLSRDGSELIVQTAPLPLTASTTDESWLVQSSLSSAPKKQKNGGDKVKILYAALTTCHTLPISSVCRNNAPTTTCKGSSFAASFSSPDTFAVASDQGVMIGAFAKYGSWQSEIETYPLPSNDTHPSLSFDSSVGNVHTIISGGPVSSLNNRPGVLFVENNSVYASRLTTSDLKVSMIEKIGLQDPVLMHVLQEQNRPWSELRTTRIAVFAQIYECSSSQPRLIPSPSGRYLCLFWENEMRYEILHARSLLTKEVNTAEGSTSRIDPSVDSGCQILSFAWIGDDDRFAILHYVDLNASKVVVQSSPARGGEPASPPPLDSRRKVFSRLISSSILDVQDGRTAEPSIKPYVELKKLAEAQIDAVELAAGAGVAAATTVDLGRLSIRGGDRSIPAVLFGGPALCVGCVSIIPKSNESSIDNSMAYFYARKSGAVESHDEKATSYITIGPEIPYPSLVAWDDEGKLCAMALGSRVAIYLSEPPNFILLGAVLVGKPNNDSPLISMKFIHGVMYCSTQSSVHAIFLGNLKDRDTVCEMDVYTIATNEAPTDWTNGTDSLCPVPAVSSLTNPHVLAYHCGGLLITTSSGLKLISLSHPVLRIGTLLASNLVEKARKWIYAVHSTDHDTMSHFLIRRGHPDLAISDLHGLSVERYIDLCMLYDHIDDLEYMVEKEGPALVSQLSDWKRGNMSGSHSVIFCIGLYLLRKGRMNSAKKWTEYALNSGINEVISDSMKLALYISAKDTAEGEELTRKATEILKLDSSGQLAFLVTV